MFLKSIELFGFKSFADRTSIDFVEGISALLGPNGCGKSNVVDAIKWVLGEQATKTLRAERMEDVIFNGTENRKALNLAEVTLTLANDGGLLPVDISEVAIKRRLHRSGESEYFINGTPVRLKEVRELFYDTGVGKSAYSIMEQGKIDQVLSNRPEDRRLLFEEAASITKYRLRGQEAERKLEKTEENMRQVEGILGEVKRSHDSLKVQADKTLKYRGLREDVFNLDRDIQLLRLKEFLERKNERAKQLGQKNDQRDAVKKTIDGINDYLEKHLDVVNEMESRLVENQKRLYGLELEKENLTSQERMLGERVGEFEAKLEADRSREKNGLGKIEGARGEQAAKRRTLSEFEKRLGEIDANITAFENDIKLAEGRIHDNNRRITQHERGVVNLETSIEELQNDLRGLTDALAAELDARLKESGYTVQERRRLEEAVIKALESIRIMADGKARLLADAKELSSGGGASPLDEVSAQAAFAELGRKALEAGGYFEAYKKLYPAFLEEFLSPQGIMTRKREIDGKIEEDRAGIAGHRAGIEALRADNQHLNTKIEEYRKTLEDLRLNRVKIRTQMSGMEETLAMLTREIQEQERFIEELRKELALGGERLAALRGDREKLHDRRRKCGEDEEKLKKDLAKLETSISEKNKDFMEKERTMKARMEDLTRSQGMIEKLQMELAELAAEIRNIYENFREKYSRDLTEFESLIYEIQSPSKDLRDRLAEVREELRKLGQVNLMAPEEYAEVKERYDFLSNQLGDLRKAREDLERITTEIRTESAELFLDTYEKIRKNFHAIFRRLFGGGRAELKLLEPENVLESGIEIFAQPPGKKLENVALLSGGERSLTAVSLLFATYMVKPSPFCLLDEIDAALDENNVIRFISMLGEFASSSQFIVITHNKKTVAGARTLLGVTMEESGVSKVVAIRLNRPDEDKGENVEAVSRQEAGV